MDHTPTTEEYKNEPEQSPTVDLIKGQRKEVERALKNERDHVPISTLRSFLLGKGRLDLGEGEKLALSEFQSDLFYYFVLQGEGLTIQKVLDQPQCVLTIIRYFDSMRTLDDLVLNTAAVRVKGIIFGFAQRKVVELMESIVKNVYEPANRAMEDWIRKLESKCEVDHLSVRVASCRNEFGTLKKAYVIYENLLVELKTEFGTRTVGNRIRDMVVNGIELFREAFAPVTNISTCTHRYLALLECTKQDLDQIFEFLPATDLLGKLRGCLVQEITRLKDEFILSLPVLPEIENTRHLPGTNLLNAQDDAPTRIEIPPPCIQSPPSFPPLRQFVERSIWTFDFWLVEYLGNTQEHHCCRGHPLLHALHIWLDPIYESVNKARNKIIDATNEDWEEAKEFCREVTHHVKFVGSMRSHYFRESVNVAKNLESSIAEATNRLLPTVIFPEEFCSIFCDDTNDYLESIKEDELLEIKIDLLNEMMAKLGIPRIAATKKIVL